MVALSRVAPKAGDQVIAIRDALKTLPQVAAQTATTTPDLRSIFTARSHEGAIDPDREIVVGDRGVGKSFWSSVLRDDAARTAIAPVYPSLRLNTISVSLGFAEDIARPEYPSSRTLKSLLEGGAQPEFIWRAVILNAVGKNLLPGEWVSWSWSQRVGWLGAHVEGEEAILTRANDALATAKTKHLIIFDALDRLGSDWGTIRSLAKALLSVALDMRSFDHFCVKVFLRPDMDGDREIWTIRDGSKLRQNLTSLQWTSRDLYGFVWHWFLHGPDARMEFIQIVRSATGRKIIPPHGEELVKIPDILLDDDDVQRKLFERIAGNMMGAGSKKGHPYTWIPKHLADARGRVSLRSFIIALREAARATPGSASSALTHDPIKTGVQQASLNRVAQLKEDYAWIEDVLKPLAGLQTPNQESAFIARWADDKTVEKILSEPAS